MWTWRAEGVDAQTAKREESLFTLADGLLGWRGNYEEGVAAGYPTIHGCYLNGFSSRRRSATARLPMAMPKTARPC